MEKFNRLNEIQSVQQSWEKGIIHEDDHNPLNRFNRFLEEVDELREAIGELDGTPEKQLKAGLELADVFIIGLGIADSLGLDIERLIFEKLKINHHKYNLEEAQQLRDQGMSHQDVINYLKKRWKSNFQT